MPCYSPMHGWRSRKVNESGKRSIVFNPRYGLLDMPVVTPCGQCIGCRLEKSRQWAIRICHEASLYDDNLFLTLTYNNESLPENGTLKKEHFTKFIKRLRRKYKDKKIRYFMCGEYGEKYKRPHYHVILFNHDFKDKEVIGVNHDKQKLYRSEELDSLWSDAKTKKSRGFCTIGQVSFESAAYVARYCTKKITGKKSESHYRSVNIETGEEYQITPEYAQMSRKPAIGFEWFKKYKNDIYNHDVMSVRCKNMRPPKYYDKEMEKIDPQRMAVLKKLRKDNAIDNPENDYYRLLTKCELQHIRARKLHRSFEND